MKAHHALHLTLGIGILVLIGLCLSGCSVFGPRPELVQPGIAPAAAVHGTGLGAVLVYAGSWLIYAGVAALVVGALGAFFCITPWGIGARALAPVFEECAVLGAGAAVLGSLVAWLGVHSWLLYLVAFLAALIYAYRHRSLWLPTFLALIKHRQATK